jgi:hypothetical protein
LGVGKLQSVFLTEHIADPADCVRVALVEGFPKSLCLVLQMIDVRMRWKRARRH